MNKQLLSLRNEVIAVIGVGIIVGLSTSFFLWCLNKVTQYRNGHLWVTNFLPIGGILVVWAYQKWGKQVIHGIHLVFREIHHPKLEAISILMSPLIFFSTLVTHLCGGSAGREGTALQIGVSLSDWFINHFNKLTIPNFLELKSFRRQILISALGASFGCSIGAPLAGLIFGFEATKSFNLKDRFIWVHLIKAFLISSFAILTANLLNTPHTIWPKLNLELSLFNYINLLLILKAIILGIVMGLVGYLFLSLNKFFKKGIQNLNTFFVKIMKILFSVINPKNLNYFNNEIFEKLCPYFIILFGSMVLLTLYHLNSNYIGLYSGLGIEQIKLSFLIPQEFSTSILKMIFTILTLTIGFKGGEFIPLVYIGSVSASSLAPFLIYLIPITVFDFNTELGILTTFGFGAVFGAVSKTPFACAIMVCELFGFKLIIPVLISNYIASKVIDSKKGIYMYNEI